MARVPPGADAEGAALVVGGDGLVGRHIRQALARQARRIAVTSRRPSPDALPLDLRQPDFAPLLTRRYGCAYLCAAVTDMRACESEPEGSRRVNVTNTLALVRRLAEQGAHLVFFSSGQVFDGETPSPDEGAPTNPKNVYGAQKVEVEEAIGREGLPVGVLRLTKVLAAEPAGLFKAWLAALRRGEPIVAATNMALAPVSTADAAAAAIALGTGRRVGLWHLSSADELDYHAAARLMARSCRLPLGLVHGRPVGEAEVPSIFRHRHAALGAAKIARELDLPLRRSEDVLSALFAAFADRG